MSQIEIRVLKQGIKSRKVMTCCFFTTSEAYRDFSQYIGNLKRFVKDSDHLTDYEIRIYTDDTGKDYAIDIAAPYPHISVLHYNCPDFRDGRGHIGMFGTLVRFLPMFEDLDIVWCSDIDISKIYLDPKTLTDMNHYKADVYYNTFVCYDKFARGRVNAIVAFKLITKIQFPRALLTRYLNMVKDGKVSKLIERMNKDNVELIKNQKAESKLPYGIDELFINTYIYNWIVNKNLRVLVDKDYSSHWLLFRLTAEEKKVAYRYRLYPSITGFHKLKKIMEDAAPIPEIADANCYKDFRNTLPRLTKSFVIRRLIAGSNLEKD
jgi:hypothetical protein